MRDYKLSESRHCKQREAIQIDVSLKPRFGLLLVVRNDDHKILLDHL